MKNASNIPLNIILILLLLMLPTGCEKSIFFSSGSEESKTIVLGRFVEIHVNGIFEIELKNDPEFSVQLTGKEKTLNNISIHEDNNILKLSDMNSLQWLPDYPRVKVTISFPDLKAITINEPAKLFSRDIINITDLHILVYSRLANIDLNLKASSIYFRTESNDFGYYTLKGYSDSTDIKIYGSTQLDASKLQSKIVRVRSYSTGGCYVYAENQLRVWLEHYGNIYYKGTPDEIIIESMTSSGNLINLEQGKSTISYQSYEPGWSIRKNTH